MRFHSIPLWQLLVDSIKRLFADETLPLAGNIAFRMLFSVFPFMIFLTALASMIGNEQLATRAVDFLFAVAPAKMAEALSPEVHSILTVPRTGLFSLSILLTVWSSMAGVDSARLALNRAYGVKDQRSLIHIYSVLVLFLIGAALLLIALSLLLIIIPLGFAQLEKWYPGVTEEFAWLAVLRIPLAVTLLTGGLIMAHRFLPDKPQRLGYILPGVVFTIIVWIVMTMVFSYVLVNYNNFATTYSSLSGIFALMFFVYLSALVLILGGELNRVLEIRRGQKLAAADVQAPAKPANA